MIDRRLLLLISLTACDGAARIDDPVPPRTSSSRDAAVGDVGAALFVDAGLVDAGTGPDATVADTGPSPYPSGPYGNVVGDVLEDMHLAGYVTATPGDIRAVTYASSVRLSELRELGYRFALLSGGAAWCVPCREEAMALPGHFTTWAAKGGLVISVLTENESFTPADQPRLDQWIREFSPNHPMLHDPRGVFNRVLQPTTYPVNVVVELETMEIERVSFGVDMDVFTDFEAMLD